MTDGLTVAGVMLVASALGAVPVAYPPLLGVWSAPREEHVRIIAGHRRAWAFLNAGFFYATVMSAAGLAAIAVSLDGDRARTAALAGVVLAYGVAGALWCAVLAIRTRATPALGDLGATDRPPEAAELLLHAATGSMFAAFVLATGAALVALGVTLGLTGGVAAPAAWFAVIVGALSVAIQVVTGDFIPAILYLPTVLIGLALLAGWT